ncbi:MAG: glycosyltransferase [Proteobacteria bacterium]|nr:MAG: glycosyltransferase [Pseudomonadota bacterium]
MKKLGRADRNTVVAWNALPSRKLVNISDVFIVYDHGLSSIHKPQLENRQKLSLASSIVCISRANEILLRERWDWQGKTSVVMNPLRGQLADAPLPETPRSLPNGPITLGCTARLVSFKGIASAVLALAILRKRFDVRLKIAGDGEEMENLRTTSIRLGLEDFVEFSGLIEDVPAFLQSVDIFLAPSLREPFGLSPLEAMAMGIPTVLTAVDGHADVLPFPGAATLLEPTLSLDKYQALGASKRRMPLFVYSPLTNELVPPKALDPESLAVAIEDILNSFADHAQTALEAGRQIRIRNSMAKYVSSLNIALAK